MHGVVTRWSEHHERLIASENYKGTLSSANISYSSQSDCFLYMCTSAVSACMCLNLYLYV